MMVVVPFVRRVIALGRAVSIILVMFESRRDASATDSVPSELF